MRNYQSPNEPIIQVHISDIHFGSVDPKKEYEILLEQFLNPISQIKFHILSIDGDLFHKKYMANSEPVYYAVLFVNQCIEICKQRNATFVIISGTESHDANQLQLFNYYTQDPSVDVRIVNHIGFEYIYGLKILCIPEEYGKGEEYYTQYLNETYDCCFFHGTIVGSIYGANQVNLDSPKYPIFDILSFGSCRGPIIGGHVHKAMCLNQHIYYTSNPVRFAFGEEEAKGYAICVIDPITMRYLYHFMPIVSFRYDTIRVSDIKSEDPNRIIQYLDDLKATGIDKLRVDFTGWNHPNIQHLVEQYYSNNPNVSIKGYSDTIRDKINEVNTTEEILNKYDEVKDFLLDMEMDPVDKLVRWINYVEGMPFVSVDIVRDILSAK